MMYNNLFQSMIFHHINSFGLMHSLSSILSKYYHCLLNFDRSLASTTTNKVANQINLPQDKNLEDCKRNHVSNGSAIRSQETKETSMHHNHNSKVADLKKPQHESQNNMVCIKNLYYYYIKMKVFITILTVSYIHFKT